MTVSTYHDDEIHRFSLYFSLRFTTSASTPFSCLPLHLTSCTRHTTSYQVHSLLWGLESCISKV
ncbi:hypothetical protein E2C01_026961 [Portunus trituberculatus]|uniref:Uncharacterized protein n=1 Tax=Portunus trituberculatus TaxID=210409 RepID=A0A5B7EK90_PORTR|nr:hypothetical protein [Portunus trituberculatus]